MLQYEGLILDDAQASFAQASYSATLGSSTVTVTRVSGTRLGLYIDPSFPVGDTTLSLTADGNVYPAVALHIDAAPVIADPVTYEHTAVAAMESSIQTAQQQNASRTDLAPIFSGALANVQAFDTAFQGWDAPTQAAAAALLAANDPTTARGLFDGHPLWQAGLKVMADFVVTGSLIAASAGTGGLAAPLALAAGSKLASDLVTFVSVYGDLTSTSDIPVDSSDSIGDALIQAVSFQNGTATAVPLTLLMRNLSQDDLSSTVPGVVSTVKAVQEVDDNWAGINADVPNAMGSAPKLSDVASQQREEPPDATLMHVANITSTDVTLASYVGATGSASITFDAASCTGSPSATVSFTFDLVYDDGTFPSVSATIPATLSCAPPTCGGLRQPCCASTGCNSLTDYDGCGTNLVDPLACTRGVDGSQTCCLPTGTRVWTDLAYSACCTPPVDPRGGTTCTTAYTTCG